MKWRLIGVLAMAVIAAVAVTATIYGQGGSESADEDADGVVGVASVPSSSGAAAITSLANTSGTILIDRSHGQSFDVSGFINYLESAGWTSAEITTGPITAATLAGADILLIPMSSSAFSAAEQAAVAAFVQDGGGLWAYHEYYRDPTGIDSLTSQFGVTFNNDIVSDPTNNEQSTPNWPTIYTLAIHPVTDGVGSFGYYAGASLNVSSPAQAIAEGDNDTTAGGPYEPGTYPPVMAVAEVGSGCGVFTADITPLHPSYYPSALDIDEVTLLDNIVDWLVECGQQPPVTGGEFIYSVKIVCAPELGPAKPALVPGMYRTAVNVHNPWDRDAIIEKWITLSPPQGYPSISGNPIREVLNPWGAFDVDCIHMRDQFGLPQDVKVPGGKGFMVIKSSQELDVVAVYTSMTKTLNGVGHSMDVEYIMPKMREPVPEPGLPDLKVQLVYVGLADTVLRVEYKINNLGASPAGPFELMLEAAPSYEAMIRYEGLAAGADLFGSHTFGPGPSCYDPYYGCTTYAWVDSMNEVAESDETNNTHTRTDFLGDE